jgi:mannose/fructose/N-acetylgalactosamine-specific phosphotransferase system component IID
LSNFFKELCAKEVDPICLQQLEKDMVVTICKLEKKIIPIILTLWSILLFIWLLKLKLVGPKDLIRVLMLKLNHQNTPY